MSDRELLEAAARAAGIELEFIETVDDMMRNRQLKPYIRKTCFYNRRLTDTTPWNPLTDDGDALRLAVKLQIHINYAFGNEINLCANDEEGVISGDDPMAQARVAIVRAAAAIGNKLEKSEG